ncbi:MAG: LysR family transcriptional regulator [Sutterellaceae bacterium]|nr:LysR family transcriptional regulator [Burkholderiaceae bacterium]MCX7901428.1 LysR family transcriptional regulator [Burkholderiaceae bacterium]MDW8428907.1 LysR family transcriptional regulator [Sutterellaceae bacterium]
MAINLSTRELRVFLALADTRNFTRAAQRCHLSQSAFSARVRAIEVTLGARLFDRDTRHVELTPAGRLLEAAARRLLAEFDELVEDFRAHAMRRKGRVALAALPSLAAGWLPPVLAEFRAAHPGIDLYLADRLSETCIALVRDGRVDLALASTDPNAPDLIAEELARDDFRLVCRRDHPLASKRTLTLRDAAAYPFIHLERSSSVRQHLEAALHPLQMRSVLEVEHLATVAGMVVAGLGISIVPSLTLFHFRHPEIAVRRFSHAALQRSIYLVRRRHASLSAAAEALYKLLQARRPRPEVRLSAST